MWSPEKLYALPCDLEVKAADVLNAYVMAPNHEKIWTALDQEFGDNAGHSAIIVGALYGLKVQVHHLGHTLHNACVSWGIGHVTLTLTCE